MSKIEGLIKKQKCAAIFRFFNANSSNFGSHGPKPESLTPQKRKNGTHFPGPGTKKKGRAAKTTCWRLFMCPMFLGTPRKTKFHLKFPGLMCLFISPPFLLPRVGRLSFTYKLSFFIAFLFCFLCFHFLAGQDHDFCC